MKLALVSMSILLFVVGCTSTPPLPTATPTTLPTPTIPPTPTVDTREIDYLRELDVYLDDYHDSYDEIKVLLETVVDNPAFMFLEDWQNSLSAALESLTDASREMRLVSAPAVCDSIYDQIVNLDEETRSYSDNLTAAFVGMNTTALDLATENVTRMNQIIDMLNSAVEHDSCQ